MSLSRSLRFAYSVPHSFDAAYSCLSLPVDLLVASCADEGDSGEGDEGDEGDEEDEDAEGQSVRICKPIQACSSDALG